MNASLDPSLGQKSEEGIGTRIETGERRCRGGTEPVSEKALAQTVATTFSVFQGSVEVAHGSLGSNERNNLPEGDYN